VLEINMEFHKGVLFIRLEGSLNKNTVDKLKYEVTSFIKENGIRNIVYNISKIQEIDCYGINALINNYTICRENNGQALVCGMNDEIVRYRIKNSELLNYMYEAADELNALDIINL